MMENKRLNEIKLHSKEDVLKTVSALIDNGYTVLTYKQEIYNNDTGLLMKSWYVINYGENEMVGIDNIDDAK